MEIKVVVVDEYNLAEFQPLVFNKSCVLNLKNSLIVGAYADNEPAGIIISRGTGELAQFVYVMVKDEYRHQGVGKLMAQTLVVALKAKGVKCLAGDFRESNTILADYCKACGAEEMGTTPIWTINIEAAKKCVKQRFWKMPLCPDIIYLDDADNTDFSWAMRDYIATAYNPGKTEHEVMSPKYSVGYSDDGEMGLLLSSVYKHTISVYSILNTDMNLKHVLQLIRAFAQRVFDDTGDYKYINILATDERIKVFLDLILSDSSCYVQSTNMIKFKLDL